MQLLQQLVLPGEHLGQDPPGGPHQLRHIAAGQFVHHGRALTGGRHDAGAAQHRELLGETRRFDPRRREQIPYGHRPVLQQLQHPDPDRMPLESHAADRKAGSRPRVVVQTVSRPTAS
ncbi:hypothetical protein GA0115259_103607 [Streptomyces sp. MnatMP-M17]|nr:hypothetical protein GA0115259_103607 [Streptomyces sp. MnatMP-M17]